MNALTKTDFHFDGQTNVYKGKVRDVYTVKNDLLVMVATDRISAFDVVLPKGTGNSLHPTQWLPWDFAAKDFPWK